MSVDFAPAIPAAELDRYVVDGGYDYPQINLNGANGAMILRELGLFSSCGEGYGQAAAEDVLERVQEALDRLDDRENWLYLESRLRQLEDLARWAAARGLAVHWH